MKDGSVYPERGDGDVIGWYPHLLGQLAPGRLGGHNEPGRTSRCDRVAARKNRDLIGECKCGSVKNVASCTVTTVGTRAKSGWV